MKPIRLGVIGVGSMGAVHAQTLASGSVPGATLGAVCDIETDLAPFAPAAAFTSSSELIRSGLVDAVIIATPHLPHVSIGIEAMRHGLHVLVEKPIAVDKAGCERLIAAHKDKRLVFAAMFNQRTDHRYQKLRELVQSGALGSIHRINWIITNWFRSQVYYDCSKWRATWAHEGGGVLLNQCPHNLDLWQWIFGMPSAVRAFCRLGQFHDIEVEDDVTAYFEFANGATGVFVTTTGDAPGTNRLEVSAENGRLVLEGGQLTWDRTAAPVTPYSKTTMERWAGPETTREVVPTGDAGEQHLGILKNFVAAIADGAPLIAPAEEGIHSVELANAMLYSSGIEKTVRLPLSARSYAGFLRKRIAASSPKSNYVELRGPRDLANSFGKA